MENSSNNSDPTFFDLGGAVEPDSGVFEKLIEAPFSSSQVLHFDLFTGLGAATWSMVNMGWCSHTVLCEKDQWLRSLAEKRFETEATWKDIEEVYRARCDHNFR